MRWAKLWPYSIMQVVTDSKVIDSTAAALMSNEELALYSSARKGRQVVVSQLRQLMAMADMRESEVRAARPQTGRAVV